MSAASDALRASDPIKSSVDLFRHPLYKKAHPTPEHLLPLLVPVAAADGGDVLEDMYVGLDKLGLGWGMWRWSPKV